MSTSENQHLLGWHWGNAEAVAVSPTPLEFAIGFADHHFVTESQAQVAGGVEIGDASSLHLHSATVFSDPASDQQVRYRLFSLFSYLLHSLVPG
jgi:hypothetical protein